MANTQPKLSKKEKISKANEAFENMIDEQLSKDKNSNDDDIEWESISGEELSDDSDASSVLSDPMDEFTGGNTEKIQDNTKEKKKKRKKETNNIKNVLNYMNKLRDKMLKGLKFIDYGPPYTKKDPGGHLGDECAEEFPSLYRIHTLLNNRANPNIPDSDELYFTPMHWCGRYCHLLVFKMLTRKYYMIFIYTNTSFFQFVSRSVCMVHTYYTSNIYAYLINKISKNMI